MSTSNNLELTKGIVFVDYNLPIYNGLPSAFYRIGSQDVITVSPSSQSRYSEWRLSCRGVICHYQKILPTGIIPLQNGAAFIQGWATFRSSSPDLNIRTIKNTKKRIHRFPTKWACNCPKQEYACNKELPLCSLRMPHPQIDKNLLAMVVSQN